MHADLFDFKFISNTTTTKTLMFVDIVYPVNLQKLLTHKHARSHSRHNGQSDRIQNVPHHFTDKN